MEEDAPLAPVAAAVPPVACALAPVAAIAPPVELRVVTTMMRPKTIKDDDNAKTKNT